MTDRGPSLATLVTEPLGGGALTRAAVEGRLPAEWYVPVPRDVPEWTARARDVAASADPAWYARLEPAIAPQGRAATRLERVVREGGVLVTTGQQPGLFGGPMLAFVKAISAAALADELEAATGVPTAPLFWAATDDADFEEARGTRVALAGGVVAIEVSGEPDPGTPVADVPLGDLSAQWRALEDACGSAANISVLETARAAYAPGQTIGGAYVALMRRLLEPLGMAVLDASHRCLLEAARPLLARALTEADRLGEAVAARSRALQAAGYAPQVQEVPGLSLVFTYEQGRKRRLPVREAASVTPATQLGATVLLRPVMERALLPTVAYCGGPGEVAYFAQVSAVARTLGAEPPLVVPRWSATVVEPHVQRILDRLGISRDELRAPRDVETRLARAELPDAVAADLAGAREGIERLLAALEIDDTDGLVPSASVQGTRRAMLHRLERLERRYVAAIKRRETTLMRDLSTAVGALQPDGKRQERALNFLPMLARQGAPLLEAMRAEAARHARGLLGIPRVEMTGAMPPATARP